jgi:AraC family transcriptional regulator
MAWIESLQKAIDYMEDHILEPITIEEIAQQANASSFHFQRTFSILTDITVGDYLRRRRLTLAAQELSRTNGKIIDVAFKYGYDTPEAFSKAFSRQHGVTPSEARKTIGKFTSYNRLVIQVSLKGAEPMQYHFVDKEAFQITGIKQGFSSTNGENLIGIPKMWAEVNQNGIDDQLFQLNNDVIPGVLGVCVDHRNTPSGTDMDYWIATTYDGTAPEGFSSLEIPAAKWVVFEVRGPMPDAMQNAWKQIFSEWFPTSGYTHASGIPEMEVYSKEDPSSPDLYSEIWIPIQS